MLFDCKSKKLFLINKKRLHFQFEFLAITPKYCIFAYIYSEKHKLNKQKYQQPALTFPLLLEGLW